MIYYTHLQAFILEVKAPLYEYHFSSYPHLHAASCFFLMSSQDNVQPPYPRLIPWLSLCKQNSESHRFTLLPGLAVFSVGGRLPLRGQRTDVAYIMISKSVISAPLILQASLHTSPYGCFAKPCQAYCAVQSQRAPGKLLLPTIG